MSSSMGLARADLDHVLSHTRDAWEELRHARLLITGGTGFFGRWLVESFCHAVDELQLAADAVVVTRFPERAAFRHGAVKYIRGDVRDFSTDAEFTHVIHAATATSDVRDEREIRSVIVDGTAHVLDIARASGARRLLLTSSGAVYGPQPAHVMHVPEDFAGPLIQNDRHFAYAEAKHTAEKLCMESGVDCVIARGFAFVGPCLPLNADFAVGNFLRDAIAGGPVIVKGDGTAMRSYLYAADLAIWLWTILTRGAAGRAFNLGSEEAISIAQLAKAVAGFAPGVRCEIRKAPVAGAPVDRYVPSTRRAQDELGLRQCIALPEGLQRTWEFLTRSSGPT